MSEDNLESKGRRAFLKTSAQFAVTAPAVSMLLAASTKQAGAQIDPYGGGNPRPVCDFSDEGLDGTGDECNA